MIRAFYLLGAGGVTILTRIVEAAIKIEDQLIGGMISALDSFSREVAGSTMKSFVAGENRFHVKKVNDDYKMIFATTTDMDSSFVSMIFDEINKYLQDINFYPKNHNRGIMQNDPIYLFLDKILQSANIVYYENQSKKGKMKIVTEEGQIKMLFERFRENAIFLWRAILIGNRIVVTGFNEKDVKTCVKSLLLFLPNDDRYELFPMLEMKELAQLDNKSYYIFGMKIPSISAVPKKYWEIQIDLDRKRINFNIETVELDKSEKELFTPILNGLGRKETDEKVIRNLVSGINMKIYLVLSRIQNNENDMKSVLKEADLSKKFYQNFLVTLKELPEFMEVMNGRGSTTSVPDVASLNITMNENNNCYDKSETDIIEDSNSGDLSNGASINAIENVETLQTQMKKNCIPEQKSRLVIEEIESLLRIHQFSPTERSQVLSKQLYFESSDKFSKRKLVLENAQEGICMIRNVVISRAEGHCELCQTDAFSCVDGSDLLTIHFIDAFNTGGSQIDEINNIAAICPNCHLKIHFGLGGGCLNEILRIVINKKMNF
jgi:hypothetical protein